MPPMVSPAIRPLGLSASTPAYQMTAAMAIDEMTCTVGRNIADSSAAR